MNNTYNLLTNSGLSRVFCRRWCEICFCLDTTQLLFSRNLRHY